PDLALHPPRRRQVAQQVEGGGEAFRPAAKVEGQHGGGRQLQGGAHRLIAVGGVFGGVAAAAFGALQTAGGAAATRVLAPQGGGAQGGVKGAGARHAPGVGGLLARLDLDQAHADQLQPPKVVAVARLLEQPSEISAEFEHSPLSPPASSRFGIKRMIPGSTKQTQRRWNGSPWL